MEVIYITIGVSIIVALLFFYFFLKSVRAGQYEDVETPAVRMLFEDELVPSQDRKFKNNHK